MTFERILSHFQVRKCGTGKAQCICPAHADREASLTLTDGNDRALIKCHAGCSTEEVVIAAGLKMSDLFYGDGLAKERWRAYIENREKRKIEAVYNYASINGDAITNKQVEELWALVEADETAGKSNSEMYDSMVQKLGEYGVSAEKATQILEQYGAQAGVSSAFVEEMTGKVQALGKGFSESSSTIDTSSIRSIKCREEISV